MLAVTSGACKLENRSEKIAASNPLPFSEVNRGLALKGTLKEDSREGRKLSSLVGKWIIGK